MQPRELSIQTPHLTFAALEWGDPEGNPVIALHGWLDNAASFTPMASKLDGIRLIAVDLAGHGWSDHRPPGFSYDVWHYVEDLFYIADTLGLSRFGLLGHSLGGVLCTMAASSILPDRVTALVAIDGLFPRPRDPQDSPQTLLSYINQRRTPDEQLPITHYRSKQQAIFARTMGQFRVSRASAELLVERGLKQVGEAWLWSSDPRVKLGSPTRFTLEQSMAFVGQIRCPAHLIYVDNGPLSDLIEQHRQWLSHIHLHPMSGNHHLHMDDQVDAVASKVSSVLGGRLW